MRVGAVTVLIGVVGCSAGGGGASFRFDGGGSGASALLDGGGTTAESGGQGGTSGASGGAAPGGAGGLPATSTPHSQLSACREYLRAEYGRSDECAGVSTPVDAPVPYVESCPDVVFAPGSVRTIDGTFACAAEWRAFPCDQLARGYVPACALPGTRQPGEPCVWGMQCASSICADSGGATCSTCEARAPLGGDCSSPDVACPDGQECLSSTCVDVPYSPPAVEGEDCAVHDCALGLMCLQDDPAGGLTSPRHCRIPPGDGSPCGVLNSVDWRCAGGTVCDTGHVCRAYPAAGSPCVSALTGGALCAANAYCDGATATCRSMPSAGEACVNGGCASGFRCMTGVCAPLGQQGDACSGAPSTALRQGDCAKGLACVCSDGACTAAVCLAIRVEGQPCAPTTTVCEDLTACEGGTCVPATGPGMYETACGD